MKHVHRAGLWLLSMTPLFTAMPAVAAQPSRVVTARAAVVQDDARIDRMWLREWESAAQYYLPFEDQYICFPTYSPDRPSSNTVSPEDYCRESAYAAEYLDARGRARELPIAKPIEEAQAALWLLRDPAVGQYGFIHSGRIMEIRNRREMIVRYVHLIDGAAMRDARRQEGNEFRRLARELITVPAVSNAKYQGSRERERALAALNQVLEDAADYRFTDRVSATEIQKDRDFSSRSWRIVGYNTTDLVVDERWPQGEAAERGLNLAIVAVDEDYVTAVPAALLARPLTEIQFLEVLESRGLTKADFVAYVEEARRELRRDYIPAVIRRIEGIEDTPEEPEDPADTEEGDGGVNDTVDLAD